MTTYLIPSAIGLAGLVWVLCGEYRAYRERKRLEEQARSWMERYRETEGR